MATAGPERRVTDPDLLNCFEESEKPFLTAVDIAEMVDLSNTRVHQRLKPLVDSGKVHRRKVGNAVIYWTKGP